MARTASACCAASATTAPCTAASCCPSNSTRTASEAKYENGVLELKLAKKAAVAGRKLTIQ